MRKLALQMGVSVDGYVVGGPQVSGDPGEPEHPGVTAWKLARLHEAGLHIMGRVTYQQMAAHWPIATSAYAAPMNDLPKVVFSTTITTADWAESRIARGDLAAEIGRLKDEPGGDIIAHGGASFVQALSRVGPGRPSALLRPAPLRTGLARHRASGSSKPLRPSGSQKGWPVLPGDMSPLAVGV